METVTHLVRIRFMEDDILMMFAGPVYCRSFLGAIIALLRKAAAEEQPFLKMKSPMEEMA